ncbi:transposase [Streptomyces sp. MK7]|uniref:transposase n=1 Tax=Streptomyces sp. MK7 TaxID=3067635 RepID=UPI00292E3E4C|nr:transposase [Streptomyces sp. MK7]
MSTFAPGALDSEASFAALCGVSPVERSSGRRQFRLPSRLLQNAHDAHPARAADGRSPGRPSAQGPGMTSSASR